jgi:hypothetical protein
MAAVKVLKGLFGQRRGDLWIPARLGTIRYGEMAGTD